MACTIYTFEKGADVGKIMSQIFESRKEIQKPEKLSWSLDGHFWLQDNEGNIIEPTPISKTERCFQRGKFYYKASEPHIQKLAIEMMYRDSEKRFGYCRESREWKHDLLFHEYTNGACFHNALAYNFSNDDKYKLVFGILGMYQDKEIVASRYDNPVPAKSVFWCYGCSKYTKISEYVRKSNDQSVSDYHTPELWENRDNKKKIINV